jgi:GNAT superfamily N-acetyltransferase
MTPPLSPAIPEPVQVRDPFDWDGLLALIRAAFADMEGRIDPPSSVHRLQAADLARQAESGEVWVMGQPPVAAMVLTPKADALYLGKLAVDRGFRGEGLARRLIACAEGRARAGGWAALELQVRVELVENQRVFAGLGFVETGRTAHEGFDRPTSITFRKTV